ncbi:indolethylamine N-methyltransferase-like [Ixodes scapularis]
MEQKMLGSVASQALSTTFKEHFVGRSYAALKQGPGNIFHQEELHRIFHSDLARGETLLEVGVGPIAWYSFMSSSRFSDIVLSDLVEDNRTELTKWLVKSEDAIDWTSRAEQVAALEGYRYYTHTRGSDGRIRGVRRVARILFRAWGGQ